MYKSTYNDGYEGDPPSAGWRAVTAPLSNKIISISLPTTTSIKDPCWGFKYRHLVNHHRWAFYIPTCHWRKTKVYTDLTPTGRTPSAGCRMGEFSQPLDWQPQAHVLLFLPMPCLAGIRHYPSKPSPIRCGLETGQELATSARPPWASHRITSHRVVAGSQPTDVMADDRDPMPSPFSTRITF